jgi:rhamnogalacturonyl hydrolase YesR
VKELEAPANLILVNQTTATEYAIHRDDEVVGTGTFCPGWLQIMTGDHWLQLGVRHFRQNHPRTLFVSRRSLGARFWAGEAFEWEGGLAKTAEFVLDYSTEPASSFGLTPIRAAAPPAWTCGSQALGAPLLPRSRTALARFGYWEAKRVARMREWCRAMPTGFRHYGDAYYGGPYKGKNAYMNLEYDVHFNFLMESLRSGQTWFINAAETMARHQADIDTDHHSGQPWKHSPRHTLTRADFGHVFVRGLLLYHLMSGDQHSLDVAQEIGAWLALKVSRDQGVGNERQIGWSLYGLTGLYEVTRDAKYLDAAEHLCDRLVRGQKPTGQFDIRYDNRISFFNGIAMNGMLTVAEHTQDDALKNAILKVANRTLGMYPEYACRTLNAFSWAARETNDPRFIDVLERTWELSMQYLKNGSSTSETYAWQFRDFAARHDLCPMFEKTPAVMPAAESWLTTRCTQPEVTAFVKVVSDAPAAVMVVLEGLTTGRIDVQTLEGKSVISKTLGSQTRLFQAGSFELTGQGQVYQIKMASDDALAWQVHHDADSHVVFYDPTGRLIPELYPAAFGSRTEAEAPVVVTLEAQGEGFHKASLYDPAGHPVTTLTHFIDFQDEQTYDLELKAEPEGPMTGWSLEVYHSHVSSVSGMKPYWSATADQWFEPDQP